jgi:hypothetical protein
MHLSYTEVPAGTGARMKRYILIGLAAGFLVTSALILQSHRPRIRSTGHTNGQIVVSTIHMLYESIMVYYHRHNRTLPFVRRDSEEQDTGLLVPKVLEDEGIPQSELRPEEYVMDPWDRPYHTALDLGRGYLTLGGRRVNDRIAIWSHGPNGINEWGQGDDISTMQWGWTLLRGDQ